MPTWQKTILVTEVGSGVPQIKCRNIKVNSTSSLFESEMNESEILLIYISQF